MADTGFAASPPLHRSRRRPTTLLLIVLACVVALAGCGVTRGGDDPDNRRLRMMIPNSPGGGYDLTGRAAAQVLDESGLTGRFEITMRDTFDGALRADGHERRRLHVTVRRREHAAARFAVRRGHLKTKG